MSWFSGFRGAMAFALALNSIRIFADDDLGLIMLTITLFFIGINVLNTYIL